MAFFNLQFIPFMLHFFYVGTVSKNFSGSLSQCYFATSAELSCRQFDLFRNLSPSNR